MSTESASERVILVDDYDVEIGTAEKLEAHKEGVLHRAFSVFVVNSNGDFLLQRRAASKYHSAGLWSNTCCGHPRPGETTGEAAARRLMEEMGFACELRETGSFIYRAQLSNGLVEHELDHVFLGTFDGEPSVDLSEVDEWRWVEPKDLEHELTAEPERFTAWLAAALACLRSA